MVRIKNHFIDNNETLTHPIDKHASEHQLTKIKYFYSPLIIPYNR